LRPGDFARCARVKAGRPASWSRASQSKNIRPAQLRALEVSGPGLHLVRVLHEKHCRAPLFDCTCNAEIQVREHVSPEEYEASAREHSRRVARIQERGS
jgi:hypothetical protein